MNTAKIVKSIIEDVKQNGDDALRDYALKFDNAKIKQLEISPKQIEQAYKQVDDKLIESLKIAAKNIEKFNLNI